MGLIRRRGKNKIVEIMIKTSRDNHGLSVSKFIARTKRMKDAICVRVIKLRKYEVPEYEYKKKIIK